MGIVRTKLMSPSIYLKWTLVNSTVKKHLNLYQVANLNYKKRSTYQDGMINFSIK